MKGKIEKSNVDSIYELNGIQKGMLYHFLMEPDENLFNVQLSFSIEGDLNPHTLQQAIYYVQANNEALRSVFDWEKAGKPLQIVLRESPLSLKFEDLSAEPEEKITPLVQECATRDWNDRFDLEEPPLRMRLMKTDGHSFIFTVTHHHILYDGWSNGILLSELFSCYRQLTSGKIPVPASKPGYKAIYKALLQKNDPEKAGRFWKEYLNDYTDTSLFSRSLPTPVTKAPILRQRFSIPARHLEDFSAAHSVTKASVIYAAYGLLLHKYSGSSDILFGTTVSNRDLGLPGTDMVIGNLINTIPLRMKDLDDSTLLEIVLNVNKDIIDRNQFNGSALPEIRQILGLRPADPLYDSEIAIENYPIDLAAINCNEEFTLRLRSVYENTDTPLSITVMLGEKVEIEFIYKADLMTRPYASALARNLTGIFEEIFADCHKKTDALTLPVGYEKIPSKKIVKDPPTADEEEYIPPSRDIEEQLVRIWSELLNVGKVGVNKGFFDVGGDSLKLIRLTSRIKRELNLKITINDLAKYPTIRSFADFVSPVQKRPEPAAIPSPAPEKYEQTPSGNDIAIIGMAGRFPGAKNLEEFWENLRSGKESITRPDAVPTEPLVYAKGFLEGYDLFDTGFFDYIPTEALAMDPQMRIFHECCWEALESTGYNPSEYPGKIGLYGGASPSPFYNLDLRMSNEEDFVESWSSLTFADKDFLCPRVSYKLDLKGPSISIATACSTSLVAVDMACNELLTGKCDIAMAGGVSVTLHDGEGYRFQKGMILSPDGKCRAFDKDAEGTVTGNGAGVVVLKKLQDAIRDGDTIHAVIKGTATNNDGSRKIGFTAPAIDGQSTVIKMAMTKAGIQPDSISYIEAHGTATSLGDPIEIAALTDAFDTDKRQYCAIGSVKTNIGHLDVAAGVAGLIKTVLALKHKQLPPSLHFQNPNPGIDFANSPFYVNAGLQDWQNGQYPRRAGISSFGFGGTNAHVILEEAPPSQPSSGSGQPQLILVSAKTPSALDRNVQRLTGFLRSDNPAALPDIAFTLQTGREHFPYRKAVVCNGP